MRQKSARWPDFLIVATGQGHYLSSWERDIIRLRTRAGLEAARSRGKLGGRPRKMTSAKIARAKELYEAKGPNKLTVEEICFTLKVSRATLYSYLQTSKTDEAER